MEKKYKTKRVGKMESLTCPEHKGLLVPYERGFLCRECETIYRPGRGGSGQKIKSEIDNSRGEGITVVYKSSIVPRTYNNEYGIKPSEIV